MANNVAFQGQWIVVVEDDNDRGLYAIEGDLRRALFGADYATGEMTNENAQDIIRLALSFENPRLLDGKLEWDSDHQLFRVLVRGVDRALLLGHYIESISHPIQ